MKNSREPMRAILLGLVVTFGAVVVAPRPAAAAITDSDLYGAPRPALGLTVSLGFRSDLVRSAALDPFSRRDGIGQSALSVARRFGGSELSGLLLGFEWNHGKTTATARGADSSLELDRLTMVIEGRLPIRAKLAGFARFAPGLLRENAHLADASVPGDAYTGISSGGLDGKAWVPAADISGGLALRLGEMYRYGTPLFGFWLTAEGGYAYAGAHDLVLTPSVATQPGRTDEALNLGALAFRGPFLRFRFAVSF